MRPRLIKLEIDAMLRRMGQRVEAEADASEMETDAPGSENVVYSEVTFSWMRRSPIYELSAGERWAQILGLWPAPGPQVFDATHQPLSEDDDAAGTEL